MSSEPQAANDRTTTRGLLRRAGLGAALGTLLLALLPATTARAAAPETTTSALVVVPECAVQEGPVRGFLTASWSDVRSPDASLLLLDEDGPFAQERFEEGSPLAWDGSVLSGRLTLVAAEGGGDGEGDGEGEAEVVGQADFALTLEPIGAPTQESTRTRDGNATLRETVTRQAMQVTGGTVTATVEGRGTLVLDATGCQGSARTTVSVLTRPDTSIERPGESVSAFCPGTNADGEVLGFTLETHEGVPEATLVVGEEGGVVFGFGGLTWAGPPHRAHGVVEMLRPVGDGYEPAGTAVVDLGSAKVGQTRTTLDYQGGRSRVSTTFAELAGTVVVDGFAPFTIDAAGCQATIQTAHNRVSDPAGPRPGGPAPANDAPETATPLRLGASAVNLQTRGAERQAEAPTDCEIPTEDDSLTPGHTVWFTVTGTGGTVRLDPSGSTFNTVVSAYTEEDGALVEVACVDDELGGTAATTQPSLVLPTEAGRTYFVQVGGYAYQYGRLRFSAS